MAANVSISSVSIGTGASHQWRSVKSPRPPQPSETHVKIWFGISHVRGNQDEAYQRITRAFATLQSQGLIKSSNIGLTGSTPKVSCNPGSEIVAAIHASGRVDNAYAISLRDKLKELLDGTDEKK